VIWLPRVGRVSFTLNGEPVSLEVPLALTLLEILRDVLGLTGTKYGCGRGECGACTVIVDGRAVNACLTLASQVDGREVLTIEGVSKEGLDSVQRALVEAGAVQCGYCMPGVVMSLKALLAENPSPSPEDVESALEGNLCRCGAYPRILKAALCCARGGGGGGAFRT